MEQEKNKSKLKIIIPIAIVILAVIGIVIFTSKETKESCVGTWQVEPGSTGYYVHTIELYKGGTGKGYKNNQAENSYYPIKWEINDNVLNLTIGDMESMKQGFTVNNNTMISVDNKCTYNKMK